MACVVGTQALLFQDGGLLALGANVVNMGIIGVTVGYAVYVTLRRLVNGRSRALLISGFVSAWLSIVVSALAVALQLALSGTSPASFAVPAMGGIHTLIGIGEGLITAGGLALLYAARRDLLSNEVEPAAGSRGLVVGGVAVAVLLAILSPLASAFPDGLEWVAEQQGFGDAARDAPFEIIPDYVFPGIADEGMATVVAGIVGLGLVFAVMLLISVARRKRESTSAV
jgi:cobalt/nickel transport system permease protein